MTQEKVAAATVKTSTIRPTGIPARIVTAPTAAGAVDMLRSSPAYAGTGPFAVVIPMDVPRYVTWDGETFYRVGKPLLHKGRAHRGTEPNPW